MRRNTENPENTAAMGYEGETRPYGAAVSEDDEKPSGLIPQAPLLPEPEPPIVQFVFSYEQLKEYRLRNQPYIVRANYDTVQRMLEDGILMRHEREYLEWLDWVEANR
jgi:hypothetical protein